MRQLMWLVVADVGGPVVSLYISALFVAAEELSRKTAVNTSESFRDWTNQGEKDGGSEFVYAVSLPEVYSVVKL